MKFTVQKYSRKVTCAEVVIIYKCKITRNFPAVRRKCLTNRYARVILKVTCAKSHLHQRGKSTGEKYDKRDMTITCAK